MALKDLKIREGKVDVVVDVIEKSDPKEFQKFGKSGRVCNAKVKDESGEMTLTLWNDEIDLVKLGDKIHIINGYVGEWQGEPQLSAGRFGKIEVVESNGPPEKKETKISSDEIDDAKDEDLEEEIIDEVEEETVE